MKNKTIISFAVLSLLITMFALVGVNQVLAGGEDPETIMLQDQNAIGAEPEVLGVEDSSTEESSSSNVVKENMPAVVVGALSLLVLILALVARAKRNQSIS